MAGLGRKVFAAGEILSAADVNGYLMDQTVQVYDDATDRSSTLGTAVSEGMVSYLKDTNKTEVFDGSNWVDFSGDVTAVTAGTALSGGGTAGAVTLDVNLATISTATPSATAVPSTSLRQITVSTATPGTATGSDGDVWLQYTV